MWFTMVDKYYNEDKFYSKDDVKIFVQAKYITEEEYKKITNEDYIA